jgi:hypothetical protein
MALSISHCNSVQLSTAQYSSVQLSTAQYSSVQIDNAICTLKKHGLPPHPRQYWSGDPAGWRSSQYRLQQYPQLDHCYLPA